MKAKLFAPLTLLVAIATISPAQAENLEHTQRLLSTRQCQRCDLNGAGFVLTNLSGVDLQGANLSQGNLNQVNLSSANLQGANLQGAVLYRANLTGANLRGADLRGADLREAFFSGANLEGANLEGANLFGAIGLPSTIATPEQLYIWGLEESQRGNFRGAINYYNQALAEKPEFAHAFLARGISRFQMRDLSGALADSQQAETLYMEQGNEQGHQAAIQFTQGVQAVQEAYVQQDRRASGRGGGGGNFLNFLGSLTGLLMRFMF